MQADRSFRDRDRRGPDGIFRSPQTLQVYYDGECPICRFEVEFYRSVDRPCRIDWVNITELGDEHLPKSKSREQLLGVFHARTGDDNWVTGVDAFAVIWSVLPGFCRFAWVFRTPVLRQAAQLFYRGFLAWQRRDRARRQQMSGERHAASG